MLKFYIQTQDFSQCELVLSQFVANFTEFPMIEHSSLIQLYVDYLSLGLLKLKSRDVKDGLFVRILLEPLSKLNEIVDIKMKRTVLQKVIEIARELPNW